MNKEYIHDDFGSYRSIKPEGYFPYSAWEVDNDMEITKHEVLIDVKLLNIDMSCFLQLMELSYGDKNEIARRVMKIVDERGKFHNSVTGTGGTMLGTVAKIGKDYSNRYGIAEGDSIISLSSLTGTPLHIKRIQNVDTDMAQIFIEGNAILFENSPVIKTSDKLPDDVQLAAFEVAGESAATYKFVEPGDRVIIIGASGKFGLLCALAAKKKLLESARNPRGHLTGVFDSADGTPPEVMYEIFDEVAVFEASDITAMQRELSHIGKYDVVINCSPRPMVEPTCVMLPRMHGKVFFTCLGTNSKTAGLAAEILGKELQVHYYHGYIDKQERILTEIIAETPGFEEIVRGALVNEFGYPWLQMLETGKRLFKLSRGIIDEPKNYVFESPKSLELLDTLIRVAHYDCNILVAGETGVGKEIAADVIHSKSWRKSGRLVKINCASIPDHLLETELFGYVGGAFTGSNPKGKKGLWEVANEGVLFLDEIGEMPLALQAKLLRALEENEIFRVGGDTPIKVNVRVIAASNKNLYSMVREKKFREDLYYRLNVFYLHIPPLRERRGDILPMVDMMLNKYGEKYGISKTIDQHGRKLIEFFPWYGNIRELDNFIQKVFIDSPGNEITIADINRNSDHLQLGEESDGRFSGTEDHRTSGASAGNRSGAATDRARDHESDKNAAHMNEAELFAYYKKKYGSTRKIASACGMSQSSVTRRLRKYGLS